MEARYEATKDFYETPAWAVDAVLPYLPNLWRASVLDPCAGRGAILDALAAQGFAGHGIELDAGRAALAAESRAVTCADALAMAPGAWGASRVVMNPPFARAEEFVRRAIMETRHHAWSHGGPSTVAALLRLAFLEGQGRAGLHREFPSDVVVLSERPAFVASLSCGEKEKCKWAIQLPIKAPRPASCGGCGGKIKVHTTDSAAYAWFLWGEGRGGRWSVAERGPHASE